MADKHGGKRQGAGRKPKADELKLIELMDATKAPEEVWKKLAERIEEGDTQAIKLWTAYRYGQPKQSVDHTSGGEKIESQPVVISFKKEKKK